jgi:hypothetical protein
MRTQWTWARLNPQKPKWSAEEKRRIASFFGKTVDQLEEYMRHDPSEEVYGNMLYTVFLRRGDSMIHLSIKRNDQKPIHDWRDLQRIKNELVGKENEGIELYPAESRVIDTANQFHLWVMADPAQRIEVGFFGGRHVLDESIGGSVQRPRE